MHENTSDPRRMPAYTLAEAALCIRVPTATLRTWCAGRTYPTTLAARRSEPLIRVPDPRSGLLSFVNLVEGQVLRALRTSHELTLQNIRRSLQEYGRHAPREHPLAFEDFLTDGLDLFVERYGRLVNLSRSGQIALRTTLEDHLLRIDRDPVGPVRLFPFVREGDVSRPISLSPAVSFGRPVIEGTRVGTDDVVARVRRGETPADVATDLRLTVEQVTAACVFEEWGGRGSRAHAA